MLGTEALFQDGQALPFESDGRFELRGGLERERGPLQDLGNLDALGAERLFEEGAALSVAAQCFVIATRLEGDDAGRAPWRFGA